MKIKGFNSYDPCWNIYHHFVDFDGNLITFTTKTMINEEQLEEMAIEHKNKENKQ